MKVIHYKGLIVLLSIALCHVPLSYSGDSKEKEVAQYVLELIQSQLDIEVKALGGFAYSKVFSCSLYDVTPWMKNADGSKESSGGYIVLDTGDGFEPFTSPKNDETNAQLIACLKDDFLINSEEDAMTLLHALGTVTDDGVTTKDKALKSADGWHLTTGTFFDKFKGYQVMTDDAGKVLGIKYALELPAI